MLTHLEIKNYALIDHLNLSIDKGFSVITGETGAGKSIILGALALILGHRADTKVVRQGMDKCVVEAYFDAQDYNIKPLLEEINVDNDTNPLMLRREVTNAGKSRAFINDTPVNLQQLKSIANLLIDIHSQRETLLLADNNFQLQVVDSVAQTTNELAAYKESYKRYKTAQRTVEELKQRQQQATEERDFVTFQYNQLTEAHLNEGEQQKLEEELKVMNHSEELKIALGTTSNMLTNDNGIANALREAITALRKIDSYWNKAHDYQQRLESVKIEIEDIAADIETAYEDFEFDPTRKEQIEERLGLLYSLQQKHRTSNETELIALRDHYAEKMNSIEHLDDDIKMAEQQLTAAEQQLEQTAHTLTEKRKSIASSLQKEVTQQVALLGIPHANFKIDIRQLANFSPLGKDDIHFLFAANKNGTLNDVGAIASGGEMSRLMLVIKCQLAQSMQLPTLIFDEIDTGISGEVAQRMAQMMVTASTHMQILSITHLPQVAAKGTAHFKVEKHDEADQTISTIRPLNNEERVVEIAQMLSGHNPTQAAIDNARELMRQ